MLSYEDINNYCINYKIENGIVLDKTTNQIVLDDDIILKVKSSILIYKEAHTSYNADLQQFWKTSKQQQEYILKTMEKFGVNGEENNYGINKLINSLLSSNGHYEEMMSGNDLVNSKFSILVGTKKDYGLAYLKLKFREKGLDIEDLQIDQDLTELQHNGVSKVIINFKLKDYKKKNNIEIDQSTNMRLFSYPRANELNELEKQKQIAKQNNDEVAYNYAQSNIEKIIRESAVSVTQEQWDSMNIEQQLSFVQLKINESKVLHDKDAFDYWNSNFQSLQNKKNSTSVYEYQTTLYDMPSNKLNIEQKSDQDIVNTSKEESEEKDYKYYYQELMKVVEKRRNLVNPSEEDKKQIIGEIFYNQGYLVESLNTEEEFRTVLTAIVNDLSGNEMDIKLQNIIINDMQEKYNKNKTNNIETIDNPQIQNIS